MPKKQFLSRRSFLQQAAAGSALLWWPACAHRLAPEPTRTDSSAYSPVDRQIPEIAPRRFSGDADPTRLHEMLWDKAAFLARHPAPLAHEMEATDLVIIGGGMAGLTTAFELRDRRPIVLEQHPRFGGNSRAESWQGIDYSIGAAYFGVPDEGTPLHHFLIEQLEVEGLCRKRSEDDPVLLNGELRAHFWEGAHAGPHRALYRNLRQYLKAILADQKKTPYPSYPPLTPAEHAVLKRYDQQSILEHLEKRFKTRLPEPLYTAMEHFCWSSFGASMSEISAAAGLNFFAGEIDSIYVPRGGNGAIAESILKHLITHLPASHLRPGSVVFDVRPTSAGVEVRYQTPEGKLKFIRAKTAVMACPKFIAAKLIDDLEEKRRSAIQSLRYRSYVVANVTCRGKLKHAFYDLFLLADGKTPRTGIEAAVQAHGATDVISSHFAQRQEASAENNFVLTLYRAYPHEGARGPLLAPDAYDRLRKEVETQLQKEILPSLAAPGLEIKDIRLARWGHPLPVAAVGKIADGTMETISAPLGKNIFFVEQDNVLLPCLEAAVGEALRQAPAIRKSLA